MRDRLAGIVLALFLIIGPAAVRAADGAGNSNAGGATVSGVAPVIDVWYGNDQKFGSIGAPQRRVNILGNVSHPVGISTLKYRLNGGVSKSLSFLFDDRRIWQYGDFNIDLKYDELYLGVNTVVITAVATTGDSAQTTVTVRNMSGQIWPLPYTVSWSTLTDSAQIVDGKWTLLDGGIRILEPGYDRLISIGDTTWNNYEVTMKVTVWGIDSTTAAYDQSNGGPGIGFLLRWKGHSNTPVFSPAISQPLSGYTPSGAIGWYHWGKGYSNPGPNAWQLATGSTTNDYVVRKTDVTNPVYYGVPYYFKMQVNTVSGAPVYKIKSWQVGNTEPTSWLMTWTEPGSALANGSFCLLAHHVMATIGTVSVTPAPDGIPPVISNIVATPSATTAMITWTTDEPATSSVSYGLTSSYGSVVSDLTNLVTGHYVQLDNLQPNTIYHYAVTSADFGGATQTSADKVFQTTILTIPPAPALAFPGNGSAGNTTTLTLRWNKAPMATAYHVQLGSDATFNSSVLVDEGGITDTLKVFSGLQPGGRYYWHVSSQNSLGEGSFSNISTFTTALNVPVLVSPIDNAQNISLTPRMIWHPVKNATSYRVWIATDSSLGTTPVFDDASVTDTIRIASGMLTGQRYFWRVRASNSTDVSAFSSARTFVAGLASPAMLSPANGSTNQSVNSTLRWMSVALATGYDVQLGTDSTFASGLVVSDSMITDTSRALAGLAPGTLYYWKVRTRNASGPSDYGPVWHFTTGLSLAQPVFPANGSSNQPINVTFVWRKVTNATAYGFQLATDSTFATGLIKNDPAIPDTTRFVAGLSYKTTYYWHVRPQQGGVNGTWSTLSRFTTMVRLPDAVTLVQLTDGASGVPSTNVRFIWNHSQPGVTRYWFEMAVDSNFSLNNVDSSLVDSTTIVSTLVNNQGYFWRVRAGNLDGWGPYSQTRRFFVGSSSVGPEQGLPKTLALEQNYPNPFNPSTGVRFQVPRESKIRIAVYDVLGREVAVLVDEVRQPGSYQVKFNAAGMASGVYYYRLVTPESTITRKMLLVK